jgi:hypothetical protein
MRIGSLTIGGRCGLDPTMTFVRYVPLLSYHHRARLCWLWSLSLHRRTADERRAFRYYRLRGHQDRRVLQLWAWSADFTWQEQGRYLNPGHERRSKLSRLLGVLFEEPRDDR